MDVAAQTLQNYARRKRAQRHSLQINRKRKGIRLDTFFIEFEKWEIRCRIPRGMLSPLQDARSRYLFLQGK